MGVKKINVGEQKLTKEYNDKNKKMKLWRFDFCLFIHSFLLRSHGLI